jgi:glycosyltransferase involved in cell wall biosynthesis
MSKIFINGKFLSQRTTGVQRFAMGILLAFDRILATLGNETGVVLLCHPSAPNIQTQLSYIEQRHCGLKYLSLIAWEQIYLPFASANGYLICLGGSIPLFARRCIPTMHDAAVFLYPKAYKANFVRWYRFLFKQKASHAPFVITVSESSARDLKAFLPDCNIRVIHNSAEHIKQVDADFSILSELSIYRGRYILAVGSLNPTKNFVTLVGAYLAADLPIDFHLVIVGSVNPDIFKETSFALNGRVISAGFVSDGQLRALYESATLFVFPSMYEGFGIPPLEAMLCDCPVIGADIAVVREVCGNAVAYFAPADCAALSNLIRKMLSDKNMRHELIVRGRRISRSFSWDISGQRLRAALSEFHVLPA